MANLGFATDTQPIGGCAGGNMPPEGSGAWKVLSSYGDGTPGSASLVSGPLLQSSARGNAFRSQQPVRHHLPWRFSRRGAYSSRRAERVFGADAGTGDQLGHRFRLHAEHQFPHRPQHPGDVLHHQAQQRADRFRQPELRLVQRSGYRRFRLHRADRLSPYDGRGGRGLYQQSAAHHVPAVPDRRPGSHQPSSSPDRPASQDADLLDQRWRRVQQGLDQDGGHRLVGQLRLGLGRHRRLQRRDQRHLLPAQKDPGGSRRATSSTISTRPSTRGYRTKRKASRRCRACSTARASAGPMGRGQRPCSWITGRTTTIRRVHRRT